MSRLKTAYTLLIYNIRPQSEDLRTIGSIAMVGQLTSEARQNLVSDFSARKKAESAVLKGRKVRVKVKTTPTFVKSLTVIIKSTSMINKSATVFNLFLTRSTMYRNNPTMCNSCL